MWFDYHGPELRIASIAMSHQNRTMHPSLLSSRNVTPSIGSTIDNIYTNARVR